MDEVLECLIEHLSEEELKKFVELFNPDFKPILFPHRRRCNYLRQQNLQWKEIKEHLFEMNKKDLFELIVTKTNITKGK